MAKIKQQGILKNMVFQFGYQGLIFVIPFVLSPYLTRTLQQTSLGIHTYTNSIAYYFVMLSMLGISRHGQRIIAQNTENGQKLRKVFWSLFELHVMISMFFTLLYIMFVLFICKDNKIIFAIQIFYVLSAMFDITWLFYGLENFKSVVLKNAMVKICECILIFVLVKSPSDLPIYTAITTIGLLAGQIVMLPQAFRAVPYIQVTSADVKQHIKPLLIFSISVIAVSLYTVFDKTLLGLMSSKENVAFYEYSDKIINIPKVFISSIGTVMFPRACRFAAEGNLRKQKKYIKFSFLLTAMIGMGAMWGLIGIADVFSVVYYGDSFSKCGGIIKLLSPIIIIVGTGDIIRTQFMIPNGMDKQFNYCIILNAIINIVLSIGLIPLIGVYGAVIGTLSAETFGVIYQLYICRKDISFVNIFKEYLPYFLIGIIEFGLVKILSDKVNISLVGLVILVIAGTIIYGLIVALHIKIKEKELWDIILKKIHFV